MTEGPSLGDVLREMRAFVAELERDGKWSPPTPPAVVDHMAEAVEYERRWRRATRRLGSLPRPGLESHAVFTARGAHDLALKHLIAAINERLHP